MPNRPVLDRKNEGGSLYLDFRATAIRAVRLRQKGSHEDNREAVGGRGGGQSDPHICVLMIFQCAKTMQWQRIILTTGV